jgi:uracil-DNA glycosylase
VVGRELGKDEVRAGQPLIGAAGRLVRAGIVTNRTQTDLTADERRIGSDALAAALEYALLTNLVPYKPLGNKAYSEAIRRRFRPFLERLLVDHWQGRRLVTLGKEAFEWFRPYADATEFDTYGRTDARFQHAFQCALPRHGLTGSHQGKFVTVYPLPHPSPLNRRWFSRFPEMLATRLTGVWT